MRPALAVVGGNAGHGAPIELRDEDRVHAIAAPIRSLSVAMIAVAAGSLVAHIVLMTAAVVAARAPIAIPPQREIDVEIVREAAKDPARKAPTPAAAPAPAKKDQAKTAQAKPEHAKPEHAKPAPPPVAEQDQLKSLQDELAKLRAEEAALTAKAQAMDAQTKPQTMEASGKALALPSIGGSDGDAIGYQQLVFSQLAKAKGDGEYRGQAGVTAVRFQIDEKGSLVRVDIVHSSGNAALDGKALDIVHRAAPFPPPPTVEDRTVFANVNFVPADD